MSLGEARDCVTRRYNHSLHYTDGALPDYREGRQTDAIGQEPVRRGEL